MRDFREENKEIQKEILSKMVKTEMGTVKQTIENVVMALQEDPLFSGKVRKNELTGRVDLIGDMPWKRRGNILTDADNNQIKLYLEHNYQLTSDRAITIALNIVAVDNGYHPVKERLESLTWDGQERIGQALHHFLGAEVNDYNAEVLRMHMLAMISRVYEPGCKYDIVLCLVGPQGGGKSTFFRFLAMNDDWFTDDLGSVTDKAVFEKLNGHIVIELAEMSATATAKSIETVKAFISRQSETFRVSYGKYAEDHPRQCVFCGTSNDAQFLPFDRSGNRRFAPVSVNPTQAEVHILDDEKESRAYIDQMWAEAMEIYKAGNFQLTFSKEMLDYVTQLQKDFMPEDTQIGQVQDYLENNAITRTCVREIYCMVLGHNATDSIPIWESKKISEMLRKLGWQDVGSRKFKRYGSQKAWEKIEIREDEIGHEEIGNAV